jgi:putative ubiquitin-RnfH superfamily antitoxin RatB of RatAB toxin-antitoxin module
MALRVEVVYALPASEDAVPVALPAGAKVRDAVRDSGMLERHPEIDLSTWRLGIYGKIVAADAPLANGDRVEIYRPLAMDPKEARRRRALMKPCR